MKHVLGALAIFVAALAPPAQAEPLSAISAAYDSLLARTGPVGAGANGNKAALSQWPDVSPAATRETVQNLEAINRRLRSVANTPGENLDKAILAQVVAEEAEELRRNDNRFAFTNDSGFFTLPLYAASVTRLTTPEEAQAWIARLEALPGFYDAHIANLRRAIATGWTQPPLVVAPVMAQAQRIPAKAQDSPLYLPLLSLPATFPDADALRQRGANALETGVFPAQQRFLTFMEREYAPKARQSLAVRDVPGGGDYYRFLVKRHTTTDLTPDQIHDIGLAEVARVRARMNATMKAAGWQGDLPSFLAFLRSDPRFYAKTPDELLMRAAEIAKRADDQLPGWFKTLPRLSYGVRPVPSDLAPTYTTGRYFPGSATVGLAGGYMVNTSKLDQRPFYELPALTLHEAVPGHHLQIALAQELEAMPAYRRDAGFTAFVEGWALYAEYLGEEMGLYRDAYELFGRLSYEMWRACRLVADTGIHWKRWSLERARACFTENTALAPHNIQTELERYVSWPGQALAYKIGEIEIRRLRDKAEKALGPKFDRRAFHDAVLRNGALPLALLSTEIDRWIAATAADTP
jgi:uncharacterized protein (DUF885 family)